MENLEQLIITVVIISLGIFGLMVLVEHAMDEKAARDYKKEIELRKHYERVWKDDNDWDK